jgi:hypothetical protein
MTFEQGGIGAGREVLMENGSSLTIKDRLHIMQKGFNSS